MIASNEEKPNITLNAEQEKYITIDENGRLTIRKHEDYNNGKVYEIPIVTGITQIFYQNTEEEEVETRVPFNFKFIFQKGQPIAENRVYNFFNLGNLKKECEFATFELDIESINSEAEMSIIVNLIRRLWITDISLTIKISYNDSTYNIHNMNQYELTYCQNQLRNAVRIGKDKYYDNTGINKNTSKFIEKFIRYYNIDIKDYKYFDTEQVKVFKNGIETAHTGDKGNGINLHKNEIDKFFKDIKQHAKSIFYYQNTKTPMIEIYYLEEGEHMHKEKDKKYRFNPEHLLFNECNEIFSDNPLFSLEINEQFIYMNGNTTALSTIDLKSDENIEEMEKSFIEQMLLNITLFSHRFDGEESNKIFDIDINNFSTSNLGNDVNNFICYNSKNNNQPYLQSRSGLEELEENIGIRKTTIEIYVANAIFGIQRSLDEIDDSIFVKDENQSMTQYLLFLNHKKTKEHAKKIIRLYKKYEKENPNSDYKEGENYMHYNEKVKEAKNMKKELDCFTAIVVCMIIYEFDEKQIPDITLHINADVIKNIIHMSSQENEYSEKQIPKISLNIHTSQLKELMKKLQEDNPEGPISIFKKFAKIWNSGKLDELIKKSGLAKDEEIKEDNNVEKIKEDDSGEIEGDHENCDIEGYDYEHGINDDKINDFITHIIEGRDASQKTTKTLHLKEGKIQEIIKDINEIYEKIMTSQGNYNTIFAIGCFLLIIALLIIYPQDKSLESNEL